MEAAFIIALTIATIELFKMWLKGRVADDAAKIISAFAVVFLAAGLNALNYNLFYPDKDIIEGIKEGLRLGADSAGLYSLVKAAVGKS